MQKLNTPVVDLRITKHGGKTMRFVRALIKWKQEKHLRNGHNWLLVDWNLAILAWMESISMQQQ
jgi:hypothetical protein